MRYELTLSHEDFLRQPVQTFRIKDFYHGDPEIWLLHDRVVEEFGIFDCSLLTNPSYVTPPDTANWFYTIRFNSQESMLKFQLKYL